MDKIKSFEDLEVWQLGKDLVILSYKMTEDFPPAEQYGLSSQIRRAAVSVPGNIAEGDGAFELIECLSVKLNNLIAATRRSHQAH
jgi:hypothetical protein